MADNEAGAADPELRRMQSEIKPRAVITHVQLGAKCSGAAAKAGAAAAKPGAAAAKAGAAAAKAEAEAESSSNSDSDDSAGLNTVLCAFMKEQLHLDDRKKHFCANPTCKTNKQEKTSNGGWCFKCHQAYYCSPECQGLAWATHRHKCDGREVKGPNIPSDYWPSKVVSDAARVVVGDGTPKGTARESTRRRKKLLTAVMTFKAELVHNLLGLHVVKGPEALAKQHQIVRLSFHQIAVCFLFLGEAGRAKTYMRMAEDDWNTSKSLCPAGEFSLYAPQWETLPSFARFVSRDNNVRLLSAHIAKCGPDDVDRLRNLGLGVIQEMDEKIKAGIRFLRPYEFVLMLYHTWLLSLNYEYEYRIMRQVHYLADAMEAMKHEPLAMSTAQAQEIVLMLEDMKIGTNIRIMRTRRSDILVGLEVRYCSNPACPLERWGVTSTGKKVCPKCEDSLYCSKTCQEVDWPIHKKLCARLANVGKTVSMPCNKDVCDAVIAEHPVAALAQLLQTLQKFIAIEKAHVQGLYDTRALLECPTDMTDWAVTSLRCSVVSVLEAIISATQVLVLQGFMGKAFHQLQDGIDVINMPSPVPGDPGHVTQKAMASSEMAQRLQKLGSEVEYYMREQTLVRLLHARAYTPTGRNNIHLYAALFHELRSQVSFCREHGRREREFYARYLLWREARRYSDAYTGREHEHLYNMEDEKRIQEVLGGLDDAHVATKVLCDVFGSEARVGQMRPEERELANDMRYKQLCMEGVMPMLAGQVSRMKV